MDQKRAVKQIDKRSLKNREVYQYFEALLEHRWNIAQGKPATDQPLPQEVLSKLKAKRQSHVAAGDDDDKENQDPQIISQCPEQQPIDLDQVEFESAFAPLVSPNARAARYTGTELRNCVNSYKLDQDPLPPLADVCLSSHLPGHSLTREQALLKLSLDMPYLSLLEKNASYYVSTH